MRQTEIELINAVNELCDGSPSEVTVKLMKELSRPLPDHANNKTTFLFGTRFDVNYVNMLRLEDMQGQAVYFKATDEGDRRYLRHSDAPKVLVLKEGAPVIITRNLGGGIFNGSRGTVIQVSEGNDPVLNIGGKAIRVKKYVFDIYDSHRQKSLAYRLQYPIQLAFALTVHRSQGQTIDNVEVDCFSFFAPGQMGVAVGRCVTKSGLRVVNFNKKAAELKHPDTVYQFYTQEWMEPRNDFGCCRKTPSYEKKKSTEIGQVPITDKSNLTLHAADSIEVHEGSEHNCPWKIRDFLDANIESKFINFITADIVSEDNEKMQDHLCTLYAVVLQALNAKNKKNENWIKCYKFLHNFLVSEPHEKLCEKLFGTSPINQHQNKFSSKLVLWLMDCEISKQSLEIIEEQQERLLETDKRNESFSAIAQGKVRYIAGACIHKISEQVRNSVLKNLEKLSEKNKLARQYAYQKQKLLKTLRVEELSTDPTDPSMQEILFKQNSSRGLFVVSDSVYKFFVMANDFLQRYLIPEFMHLNIENLQGQLRHILLSNQDLVDTWVSLFGTTEMDEVDEELFMTLLLELFTEVTDHFIKLVFVDAVKEFKAMIPRKKRQALRQKITALGEREGKKKKSEKSLPLPEEPSTSVH